MTTFAGPEVDGFPGVGPLTLGAFLDHVVARFAANEALVFDDPLRGGETVRWTYRDLGRESHTVAGALRAAGVGPGDRVVVLMGSRPEAVAAFFGVALAGAVVVPLSTFAPPPELASMLARVSPAAVLTQTRLLRRDLVADLESIGTRVPVTAVGAGSWDDFLASAGGSPLRVPLSPTDIGMISFTSGTTSEPKGIVHSQRAPSLQFWVQAQVFGRHEGTRLWTSLPMFWTAGIHTAMGNTLAAGGCWVIQETFDAGGALALMARERVTEPYALPHQTAALAEHPDWIGTDLSSLTCVYGKSAFARHPTVNGDPNWNMPVAYGLSETCASFASHWWNTPRDLLKLSMGRLLPGNELRVVDPETGRPLGPGEDGELLVRGPTLMDHYLGRSPAECFDADGFFATGDAGFVDPDGFLHWTGRRTEMIKTGGANVSPAELEVQLRACQPVKLARIVAVDDDRLGQIVVACVTVREGEQATEDGIKAFLRERVAPYKVPKHVLFFADGEIPMTSSDTKVRDADLLDLVHDRLRRSVAQ